MSSAARNRLNKMMNDSKKENEAYMMMCIKNGINNQYNTPVTGGYAGFGNEINGNLQVSTGPVMNDLSMYRTCTKGSMTTNFNFFPF